MKNQEFLQFAIDNQVLKFGEFTLKSGRLSPYFFNAGLFNTGESILHLGEFYAATIAKSKIKFDVLFGPAYKGISLAAVTSACLFKHHGMNVGFAFNRKEAKDHGEGGTVVGAKLKGRILIIDDVITAGTSIRESVDLISHHGASLAGVIISLDRQEKGETDLSAIEEIEQNYKVPVLSIVNLQDLSEYVSEKPELQAYSDKISAYRKDYGI